MRRGAGTRAARSSPSASACDDAQPLTGGGLEILHRRDGARVDLDHRDAGRRRLQQRAGQAAGARADLDDMPASEVAGQRERYGR